jgi:hypothetical protein
VEADIEARPGVRARRFNIERGRSRDFDRLERGRSRLDAVREEELRQLREEVRELRRKLDELERN